MKVAVDAQLMVGTATGIGEYVRGLIGGLRARGVDVAPLQSGGLDPWRFDRRVYWDQVLLPLAAAGEKADLLHCASGTMPLLQLRPTVVTVHDVAWFKVQAHARPYARYYFGKFSLARYRHAQRIVVDSEFSRSELLPFLRVPFERVRVVYPGVADDYCALERRADSVPFLLSVGTVERRKNLAVLVRALARLSTNVRLVAVGPSTSYEAECRALAQTLGVGERIEWKGYVARTELLDLFARAAAVAVPSKYEGFGYAAAQALCAGSPLVVSNSSSLPEVVAGDVPTLDPEDVASWVAAIDAILGDRDRAEHRAAALRAGARARFAWPASLAKMCAIYEDALAGTN